MGRKKSQGELTYLPTAFGWLGEEGQAKVGGSGGVKINASPTAENILPI